MSAIGAKDLRIMKSLELEPARVRGRFPPLKPHVKAAWIAALLSGRYEQGPGLLRREACGHTTWCCLGVLCDLGARSAERWHFKEGTGWFYDVFSTFTPDDVSRESGLSYEAEGALTKLNDGGVSFRGIAAWIERVL